jgi:co-chaperonin GroES (HSP10)
MVKFKEASLGERVILKPIIEKVSKGGIVISTSERNQAINTNQGVVVQIGPQAWWDLPSKPDIKPGDTVYYSKYGGMVIKVEGQEEFYVICNDRDLLVAFEGEVANEEEVS